MLLLPWWLWTTSEHTYWGLGMTLVGYSIGLQFLETPMPAGDDYRGREGVLGYGSGSRRLWHSSAMGWGCLVAEGGGYWRPVRHSQQQRPNRQRVPAELHF